MRQFGGLVEKIAGELNIKRELEEENSVWIARVVYSVMGRMALASLYDILEDNQPVSVIHFKRRIQKIMKAFLELYPELQGIMQPSCEEFAQEIYSIYLKAGCFYHTPNRLLPCAEKRVCDSYVELVRGGPLSEKVFVSGLGSYQKIEKAKDNTLEIMKMFQISNNSLNDSWDKILEKVSWNDYHSGSHMEYLRLIPPYSRGYWKDTPDTKGDISLLRVGEPGGRRYYLYRYENGKIKTSALPQWMTEDNGYRYIANCILAARQTLPPVEIERKTQVVYIKQEYLLPPAILNFLQLYSWPDRFSDMPGVFGRVMQKEVFEVFERILQVVGIEVDDQCQMEQDQYINN